MFEYIIKELLFDRIAKEEQINQLAREGWEPYMIVPPLASASLMFRRPKAAVEPKPAEKVMSIDTSPRYVPNPVKSGKKP